MEYLNEIHPPVHRLLFSTHTTMCKRMLMQQQTYHMHAPGDCELIQSLNHFWTESESEWNFIGQDGEQRGKNEAATS